MRHTTPKQIHDGRRVVAFIGDASIVNGVAMEGLNNAGTLKRQLLIVLNDNGMGIAHPQGAIADYFDHLRVGSDVPFNETYCKKCHERITRWIDCLKICLTA